MSPLLPALFLAASVSIHPFMRSRECITHQQADKLRDQLAPMVGYLKRLVHRLEHELQIDPNDELLREAIKARDLSVIAHYMSWRSPLADPEK